MKIPTRKLLYRSDSVLLERRLKYKGQLYVKKSQKVNIFDVLGKGYKIEHLVELPIDIAHHLKVGDVIKSGDIIGSKGIMRLIGKDKGVRIDFNGVVYAKTDDKVVVGSYMTESQLISGVFGEVVDVIEDKAMLIKAQGIVIQGVEGYGESIFGELKTVVSVSSINPKLKGKVVLFSEKIDKETIDKLINVGVIGIVVGGLTSENYWYLVDNDMPFMMVHGFGDISIDTALVLETSDLQNRFVYLRPGVAQVLISENITKPSIIPAFDEIKIGGPVISISPKSFGSYGKIEEILEDGKVRVNFFDERKREDHMFFDLVSPKIAL